MQSRTAPPQESHGKGEIRLLPADHLAPPGDPRTVVVDLRPSVAYLGGHLPGALHLPGAESLLPSVPPGDHPLAAMVRLLPPDPAVYLLGGGEGAVGGGGGGERSPAPSAGTAPWAAAQRLSRAGLGPVRGLLPPSTLGAWARSGGKLQAVPPMTLGEALDRAAAGTLTLLDLRTEGEPLPADPERVIRLPLGAWTREGVLALPRPLAVVSREGRWSPAACGLLRRLGVKEVWDVVGGVGQPLPTPSSIRAT